MRARRERRRGEGRGDATPGLICFGHSNMRRMTQALSQHFPEEGPWLHKGANRRPRGCGHGGGVDSAPDTGSRTGDRGAKARCPPRLGQPLGLSPTGCPHAHSPDDGFSSSREKRSPSPATAATSLLSPPTQIFVVVSGLWASRHRSASSSEGSRNAPGTILLPRLVQGGGGQLGGGRGDIAAASATRFAPVPVLSTASGRRACRFPVRSHRDVPLRWTKPRVPQPQAL